MNENEFVENPAFRGEGVNAKGQRVKIAEDEVRGEDLGGAEVEADDDGVDAPPEHVTPSGAISEPANVEAPEGTEPDTGPVEGRVPGPDDEAPEPTPK